MRRCPDSHRLRSGRRRLQQEQSPPPLRAGRDHGDMPGVGRKRNATGAAAQRPVRVERNSILRPSRRDGHFTGRGGKPGPRQQPAREHCFDQRNRDCKPSRRTGDAEAVRKTRTGAIAVFRHPRQRQACIAERGPERRSPTVIRGAVDALCVRKIGKDALGSLRDNIVSQATIPFRSFCNAMCAGGILQPGTAE